MFIPKLVYSLDKYASFLESAGFVKEAYQVDLVSDQLSKFAKLEEHELRDLAKNREIQKSVINFLYDQTSEHGHWQEMIRHLKGGTVHIPEEFHQNPRGTGEELAKMVVKTMTGVAPTGGHGGGTHAPSGTREIEF